VPGFFFLLERVRLLAIFSVPVKSRGLPSSLRPKVRAPTLGRIRQVAAADSVRLTDARDARATQADPAQVLRWFCTTISGY
jgi:hypothetical protein